MYLQAEQASRFFICPCMALCTARNGPTVCACVCDRLRVCVGGRYNVPTHGALHVG